jgi:hypothetical protein
MRCLTRVQLQAIADGETNQPAAAHVAECVHCREQVEVLRAQMTAITTAIDTAGVMPPAVEARLREAVASGRPARGATSLRAPVPTSPWRRWGLIPALATAGVVAAVVFGVLPRLGAPTSLSASAILGRSLQTLSDTRGVERLDYELVVDGLARGAWRIEQLIDHDQPAHFRVAAYGADGTLQTIFNQDPSRQRRSQLVRVDGRNYIVTVGSIPNPVLSLPQMAQALAETAITMMQVTSDQNLIVQDTPSGKQYVIEIPAVVTATAATLQLQHARTVVDGADYRIREFEASGTILRQPFSISFKLIRRTLRPSSEVQPSEFEIQAGPEDVVFEGAASNDPVTELLETIFRELARARGRVS